MPNKAATENLFLLEFLVDRVCIDMQDNGQDSMSGMCGETCVQFSFLDNDPLEVCEADFMPKNRYSAQGASFKSGKSILFALTPDQACEAVEDFNIHVEVFKKIPGNELPDKMPIGEADIQIVQQFNELLDEIENKCMDRSGEGQPTAKVIKDIYKLKSSSQNCDVGSLSVFIRLSCFGKLIVTQFQMNVEDKSVLFKDNQGNSMYRYRKSQRGQQQDPCNDPCGDTNESPLPIGGPCGGGTGGGEEFPPCGAAENNYPPEPPDDRCYQEIGAEMNGNCLTIRVLKDKKKGLEDENFEGCACDQECCGENPEISAIPEGPNPPSLKFKVNSNANQNVKVTPPRSTPGFQKTEISDPHRDVFVLRIGKKNEGAEKKSNLELELRTPKGLDRKPPPKFETRETQFEEADCAPAGGGKGKGKGKKGKKK